MAELRLRGQEVTLRIARGNVPEVTLTAIKDFTVQFDFATIEEGYLGETTMRKDDIFNGLSGSMTIDAEGQEVLQFLDFVKQRAQRRLVLSESRVNVTARYTFPNGQTPRIVVRDLKFDAAPFAAPSRDGYVNVALSWKAEDGRVLIV